MERRTSVRLLKSISLALLLSSGVALAQQAAPAQQAGPALPATQPSADVAALIQQLGDDNYQVRQRAYFQLRDMGKAALPALREAEKSKDVEVHERAGDLLAELETPQIPRDLPEAPQVKGGFYGNFVRSEERPGMQLLDAIENGRSIHIERSNSGIRMVVRGELHGAAATREYKAASPEELKHANP